MKEPVHNNIMFEKAKSFIKIFVAFLLLGFGGGIYLIYRSRNLLIFKVIPNVTIKYLDTLSERFQITNKIIRDVIIYNLPTFLWTASFLIIMRTLCECIDVDKDKRNLLLYSLPCLLILYEFLQIINIFSGTFDVIDLLSYIIPVCISLIIDYYEKERF